MSLLALCQRKFNFRFPILEVERKRDERETSLLNDSRNIVDLFLVHQQFPISSRGVVVPGALGVLGNVNVTQPQFAMIHHGEPIDNGSAASSQGLDLGAGKHDPALPDVFDEIVMASALILRNQFAPNLLNHFITSLSSNLLGSMSANGTCTREDEI